MERPRSTNARIAGQTMPGVPPLLLLALYIALCLTPLLLASLQGLPARNFWRELSSGLVMVGFAMMLVQFLLSGRFPRVSGRVGIDLTMRFHQLAALTLFVFILAHPFLYAVPRLSPEPMDALVSLQRMFSSQGLRTGVIAWWLMIFLIPLAVWRDRLPFGYELWRLSHGLMAAAIAALSLHHTLRVGTYAQGEWLSAFWIAMTVLALLSLAHVYLFKPLMQLRRPYRVVANERVADKTWRLFIEPAQGKAIDFAPGQFVWLNLGHSPFSLTEHPFSISSSPEERPRIGFTIKENGDFTDGIGKVPLGTTAYLDGPHGNFTLAGRKATRIVFIAGGVGFAPVFGILKHLRIQGWPHSIVLIYGNRLESQILYRDEIENLRAGLDLDVRLVLSEPPEGWPGLVGDLTPEVLQAGIGAVDQGALYFVCGPPGMMDAVERALSDMGVPGDRIVTERFKYD